VLQLLVHSPPFRNLFRELKGQRRGGGPETGGGATPLVDATVRFFEEFTIMEKKENKAVNPFEPTYMYDAMKENSQLKNLLVRSCTTYRPAFTDLYRPNVYRIANSRMRKSFSACTSTLLMKSCMPYSLLLTRTSRPLPHPK